MVDYSTLKCNLSKYEGLDDEIKINMKVLKFGMAPNKIYQILSIYGKFNGLDHHADLVNFQILMVQTKKTHSLIFENKMPNILY